MADTPNSFDPPPAPQVDSRSGFASFFATTAGKLVVGAVALILVVGIVGAIAWAFLLNGSSAPQAPPTGATIINPASSTASASANALEAGEAIEVNPVRDKRAPSDVMMDQLRASLVSM